MGTKIEQYRTLNYEPIPPKGDGGVSIICSPEKVFYPKTQAHVVEVCIQMNQGGVSVKPGLASLAIAWSTDPTHFYNLAPGSDNEGMRVAPRFEGNDLYLTFSFQEKSSFEGKVKVNMLFNNNPFTKVIEVAPEKVIVYMECSLTAVNYNPATHSIYDFNASLNIDGVSTEATAIQAYYQETGGNVVAHNSNSYNGVYFYWVSGTSFRIITTPDATYKGALILTLFKDDISRTIIIPITRVENGPQGPQGEQGLRGFKGPYIRGPRKWSKVKEEHDDITDQERFYFGEGDDPCIDIVLDEGGYYRPKVTHTVYSSPKPTQDTSENYWKRYSQYELIATMLFLAELAKIKNLICEGFEMRNSQNQVVGCAYIDAEGNSHIYFGEGTFANVVVEGDIMCNTQTYRSLTPTDTVHLNDGLHVGGVISIRPNGGCLVVPGGKSDVDILLPEVEEGTVRQITVINQHLPFHAINSFESRNGRHVYIRPDPEAQNVVLFPKLTTCDDRIGNDTNKLMDLEYGAYNLYGYKARVYDSAAANQEREITAWSIWRTDSPTYEFTTPTKFEPSDIKSFGGYNKTLQTGLPPIQTL